MSGALVDRIPAGVLEMVRAAGATVASSADLVTRFHALLGEEEIASHERAAAVIAAVAREAFALAGTRARGGAAIAEHELMEWIRERFAAAGLETDHGPNVSVGAHAANPHYEPSAEEPRAIGEGEVVLIDLWAREPGGVYADDFVSILRYSGGPDIITSYEFIDR